VVVIDSDVYLIELRYRRDARRAVNAAFLETTRSAMPAITIYNLMEVLGQLSFNLAPQTLLAWESWLVRQYHLTVLWPDPGRLSAEEHMTREIFQRPFQRMLTKRASFTDALALQLAEDTPLAAAFITWNARHFREKTWLPVQTPAEYLANRDEQKIQRSQP